MKRQHGKNLKKRMIDQGATVSGLARELGHDVAVISKAINHGLYPNVVRKIQRRLYA